MRARAGAIIVTLAMTLGLSGCASTGLRSLQTNSEGPDEFLVMPVKPLTAPKDYDVLPAPTPGGTNLVDQNPIADAVVALGGRASALEANGVPASDGALVAQAGRYGVPPDTRVALAEADAEFRRRQSRMTRFRLFRVDRYEQAYRREVMDPFEANDRFRRAGIATPSAPPQN